MKLYSPKRQTIQDLYLEIREDLLCEVRHCEARVVPDCTNRADQIQHLVSRSSRRELIADARNLMTICGFCHGWVECHPDEAELAGLTVRGHDWEWLVAQYLDDSTPGPGAWDNRLIIALKKHGRPDLHE